MLETDKYTYINRGLVTLIVVVCLYLVLVPLAPRFSFWMDRYSGQADKLERSLRNPKLITNKDNQLIVPRMMVGLPIGQDRHDLDDGVWHLNTSSTPDKGGNTVFVGQRFSYAKPHGSFYFLDQLREGDEIGVYWKDKLYLYRVTASRTVDAKDSAVLDKKTDKPSITLYSGSPAWHQSKRLAVTGQLASTP